ncbi:hypothetical protein C4K39_1130 [Pseudomonas sessilinigenes]|nr:hypothetical protein C4K39_1130 [Pseudomonas sessilinigenes]
MYDPTQGSVRVHINETIEPQVGATVRAADGAFDSCSPASRAKAGRLDKHPQLRHYPRPEKHRFH